MKDSIAWAAGLFEGEGCLRVYQSHGSNSRQVTMRLEMTDHDVVYRFAGVVGGTVRDYPSRSGHKSTALWYVHEGKTVAQIIRRFLPYLGARRRAKALEVLAVAMMVRPRFARRTHCPAGHAYTKTNTYVHRGSRFCRACRRHRQRAAA